MRVNAVKIGLACLLLAACERTEARRGGGPRVQERRAEAVLAPDSSPPVAEDEQAPPAAETDSAPVEAIDDGPALAQIEPELEIPEPPRAPDDYGQLSLVQPTPAPEELTMHGLAGYEVVAIYAEPNIDAPKLGYLRLGARMKVTEKIGTEGCAKGWHGLAQGGFACASKGLLVDAARPPYLHRPPPPPRMGEAMPYRYAYVRRWNSPMWWKIPSAAEQAEAEAQRAVREAIREGTPVPGADPSPTAKSPETQSPETQSPETQSPETQSPETKPAETAAKSPADALPSLADDAPESAETEPAGEAEPTAEAEPEAVATPEPIELPLSRQTPWLEKGFFISLADKLTEEGKTWWHTARGAYVEAGAAYEYQPKDFQGVELGEEVDFPFGYAMVKSAKVYELDLEGKLRVVDQFERRTFVDLSEEIEVAGKAYMMTPDGRLLRKKDLRLAERRGVPEGIEPWERWIDVSLSKQMLVAYEGDRPVFTTLTSTGRKNTQEETFETPTGRYRIRAKHVSTTMDGPTLTDGNYSIQDVPWAMFFEGSYALHGAFWHNSFGRVRSHGCVNLGATDARWLFMWTTPFLPEGWHGVHAHEGSPGTTVIVRP